jgi:hypothetical protein
MPDSLSEVVVRAIENRTLGWKALMGMLSDSRWSPISRPTSVSKGPADPPRYWRDPKTGDVVLEAEAFRREVLRRCGVAI